MSAVAFLQYAAGVIFLLLASLFALLTGPLYYMIDDANEPGPPQNRRNAVLFSAGSFAIAAFCIAMAAR